jgi:hypothetical protein
MQRAQAGHLVTTSQMCTSQILFPISKREAMLVHSYNVYFSCSQSHAEPKYNISSTRDVKLIEIFMNALKCAQSSISALEDIRHEYYRLNDG